MFKFKQIKLNKIKELSKKWLRALGENPFLTSLALILLSLIIGALVFYQYSVLAEKRESGAAFEPLILEQESLGNILKTWQDRQERFDETDLKSYPDPFRLTK